MPLDPTATTEITAFRWVPDFAAGLVRDLRVRWALEEIGRPYRVRLLDAMSPRPKEYFAEQPFGQVPAYRDDQVQLFESGAILIHLAIEDERLLPFDRNERMRAVAWMIAALNSVEPLLFEFSTVDIFAKDEEWAKLRRPSLMKAIDERLHHVSNALGNKQYLEGRFTIGDLVMTTILRDLRDTDLVERHPNLTAYQKRCEERPAFQRALSDQLSVFAQHQPEGEAA